MQKVAFPKNVPFPKLDGAIKFEKGTFFGKSLTILDPIVFKDKMSLHVSRHQV
jgi:hypothetical protein